MADLWSLVAILIGYALAAFGIWRTDQRRRRRVDAMVDQIVARGTITIAHADDGDPICPHCGHTLRSEG